LTTDLPRATRSGANSIARTAAASVNDRRL
jgi:hypothetical protein